MTLGFIGSSFQLNSLKIESHLMTHSKLQLKYKSFSHHETSWLGGEGNLVGLGLMASGLVSMVFSPILIL